MRRISLSPLWQCSSCSGGEALTGSSTIGSDRCEATTSIRGHKKQRERERGMDLLAITNTWKCFPTSFAPLANCVAQSHELEAPATFIGSDGNSNSGFPPPTASASVTRVALLSCPLFRYLANVGKRRPWHRTWTTWLTRPGQPSSEYPKNNPLQYYRQFTPASPVVAGFPWISMQVDAHEKLPGPA